MAKDSNQPLLELNRVSAGYGKTQVLWDLSLSVGKGEIVCLIGPNGAGKSTTIRTIMGIIPSTSGMINLAGRRIDGLPTHEISNLGVSAVLDRRELFPRMSVYENLLTGATRLEGNEVPATVEEIYDIFPVLKERKGQAAETLSGGEQQMLSVARALMGKPSLLILDEPSTGLSPLLVRKMFKTIAQLGSQRLSVLIAEQNVPMALGIADRGYLIENGQIALEGPRQALVENGKIEDSYLGV